MKVFWHVEGEAFVVSRRRRWNGGEPWLAQPGPHFLGRNGERTPEGRGSSLWTPFSGGCVWEAVLLTKYLACGPPSKRPCNGPPTSWAGWGRGWVPFGKRREKTISFFVFVFFETQPFNFLLSPTVNESLLPPARAGGRAMRRWSLRPQARYADPRTTLLLQQSRERGVGERNSFPPRGSRGKAPWCSFPYFFKEIGPRLGSQGSRPFQRQWKRRPPVQKKEQR